MARQFVVKFSNIRFHEHLLCASRVVREKTERCTKARRDFNTRSARIRRRTKREFVIIRRRQQAWSFCAYEDSADSSDVGGNQSGDWFWQVLEKRDGIKTTSSSGKCPVAKFCEHCDGLSSGVVVSTPHPYSGHQRFDSQGKCRINSDFSLFSADTARKRSYAFLKYLSQFVIYNKTVISTMESRQSLYSLIIHYQVLEKGQRFGVSLPC